jgi:hypothetical protein
MMLPLHDLLVQTSTRTLGIGNERVDQVNQDKLYPRYNIARMVLGFRSIRLDNLPYS